MSLQCSDKTFENTKQTLLNMLHYIKILSSVVQTVKFLNNSERIGQNHDYNKIRYDTIVLMMNDLIIFVIQFENFWMFKQPVLMSYVSFITFQFNCIKDVYKTIYVSNWPITSYFSQLTPKKSCKKLVWMQR